MEQEIGWSISQVLEDPSRYNFFVDLIKLSNTVGMESFQSFLSTLELFAFGTISDYFKFQGQFIELNANQVQNLVKLSVFDIVCMHEGKEFDIQQLYQPDILKALKALNKDEFTVELTLLQIASEAASLRIDDVKRVVKVLQVHKFRDVYDPQLYKATVVSGTPIGAYRQELGNWYGQVTQVMREYQEEENLKKRKMDITVE